MLERETYLEWEIRCVDVLLAFYCNDLSYFPYASALTCPGPDEIRCFFFSVRLIRRGPYDQVDACLPI